MEEHVPDWSFALATPPITSTSDLRSSFTSRIENVPTLPKADVLQHNYLLHKASSTPLEISGTDQGYDFHDIFNTLQNCRLINTARAGAEALPEHTVPLSWDILCNPNQAEASGSGSKRRSNIEMDDGRGCKRAPGQYCREQGADHRMREDLKDQRKARVKRTRSAELHNMSERKRRDRIREKIKTLQQLIPNCNKPDRASVLDDAIKYLKGLKLQVEMLATRGASTLDPYVSPGVSSANRAGNVNQGLLLQIRRPIIVMGPSYGLSNTSTGLSAMPFQPSPLFPTSPPLRGQAVSFPFVGARPQRFSPAASSAVNIGFFPPFSHWNSNPTPSAIERQACEASNLTERVMVHRTITPSSPTDYTARVQDPVWTDNRSFSQIN